MKQQSNMSRLSEQEYSESVLKYTVEIVLEAGEVLKQYFGEKLPRIPKGKGNNDFATEADLVSEKLIISRIRKRFPEDGIVSEESKAIAQQNSNIIWIVDPLDGTYNFSHGIKNCGVMITRTEGEIVQSAVLYNPFKNVMVTARRNNGVFINGEKRHLSESENNLIIVADDKGFTPIIKKCGLDGTCLWSSVDNALSILIGEKNAYFNITAKVWDLAPLSLCFAEDTVNFQCVRQIKTERLRMEGTN